MLQNIHDKAKGWVAYAIVGFIAIPFTLFGIGSYLGGGESLIAATVNGEEIPVQEVQNSVLQQRQRLAQMFGGSLPPGFDDNSIKQQALEQIVTRTLLRQESETHGYRASNDEVIATISEIPAFQVDGKFDTETYERLLAGQRRNKAGFEAEIRESLTQQQFSLAVKDAAFLPASKLSRYKSLLNQTRDIETYTLKKSDFSSSITVSEDEKKTYFESNAKQFMTPEKVKISYVELKQEDIAKALDVSDDALQAFYDENADRYREPEQLKVAHILVKIDEKSEGGDVKKAEEKAQARAQSIVDQISAGTKTFEELAATDSDDTFSAKKGGEIGFIAKGDMGPLFEKAAFSLKKGAVSEPIKAEAGFEIIKLLDVKEQKQKSFADVKAEIEKAYRAEQAEKVFQDNSETLQTLAFENEGSLDEAADAVGLKVKSSDWISKGVAPKSIDLLASPKLIAAAFSDDVLIQGKNSELIEIDGGTVAVIRLLEHKRPEQKPMSDVSEQIKNALTDQKLRKVLIEKGELVLKGLKEKGDWTAVEAIGGSVDKVEKLAGVGRRDTKLSPVLLGKVFSMQKPKEGKKTFDNTILPEGDYVLIGLSAVNEGESKEDDGSQERFIQMLGSREHSVMLKALREQAEVELFLDNIQ